MTNLDAAILDVLVTAAGRDRPEHLLYHYTDFNGLKGILASHSLWATYSRTLNDGSEQRFGETVICKLLQDMVGDDIRPKIAAGMDDNSGPYRPFVTCFCKEPTLLSMWRAYSQRGGGYCLGFDSSALFDWLCRRSRLSWLLEITYGEPKGGLKDDIHTLAKLIELDPQKRLGFTIACVLATKIKHESFKEEREWRIVIQDTKSEEMEFRQGHSNIIPYIDLQQFSKEFEQLPLREVWYGPTLRSDQEIIDSINWMLEKHGYKGVAIRHYDTPYRL
jgi:hypothetical protein